MLGKLILQSVIATIFSLPFDDGKVPGGTAAVLFSGFL